MSDGLLVASMVTRPSNHGQPGWSLFADATACDVTAPSGLRIEVKTSAYVQSWKQSKLSAISFDIAPKRGWDAATNI